MMGFNLKSIAGPVGAGLGQVIGGPVGAVLGGAMGGSIQSGYENEKQFARDRELMNYQYYRNEKLQKEFAKKGIQWKVSDAKKAGIHPLAALGAATYNASPAFVGGSSPMVNRAADMAELGQNISRAAAAESTAHQRKLMDLQLESAQYDTEMKKMEVISARRNLTGQVGPGLPDSVKHVPAEITSHAKGRKNIEAGSVTSTGFARGPKGTLTPVPSKDVKERIEDQFIPEMVWSAQNYLGPTFGSTANKPPRKEWVKGAKDYQWDARKMTWEPVFKGKARTPWQRLKRWAKPYMDKFDKYSREKGKEKKWLPWEYRGK